MFTNKEDRRPSDIKAVRAKNNFLAVQNIILCIAGFEFQGYITKKEKMSYCLL